MEVNILAFIATALFILVPTALRVPLNPQVPAEDQEITRPRTSVTVTIVLLKLAFGSII